jgi:peptide/nickel transport system permease protein
MLPQDATLDDIQRFRDDLGLNQPIWQQYLLFMEKAVQLDFGMSLRHREPAMQLVLERVPATLELTAASLAVSLIISLPLGIIAAVRRDTFIDGLCSVGALFGQCAPTFWLGILLILVVSVNLRWLPSSGSGGPEYLILPAITLGAYSAALMTRLLRSNLLEVFSRDYIRTARAKGLSERSVIMKHALRNSLITITTIVGLQMGALISGVVVTEQIFAIPGFGKLTLDTIQTRDYALLQGVVLISAAGYVVVNLSVDLIYSFLNPRIRVAGAAQ